MTKTEEQLKAMYEEFVEQFDPTPQYAYDDFHHLPDYDTWKDDYLHEQEFSNIWS